MFFVIFRKYYRVLNRGGTYDHSKYVSGLGLGTSVEIGAGFVGLSRFILQDW